MNYHSDCIDEEERQKLDDYIEWANDYIRQNEGGLQRMHEQDVTYHCDTPLHSPHSSLQQQHNNDDVFTNPHPPHPPPPGGAGRHSI